MPLFRKRRKAESTTYIPDSFLAALIERVAAHSQGTLQWKAMFSAWIMTGVTVGDIIVGQTQELRARWSGSQEEIVGVAKIFCLAMLSRWTAFVWAPTNSAADLQLSLENAAKDLLRFFGALSDEALHEFLCVHAQFQAEVALLKDPAHEGLSLAEVDLLLSLAARELGRPLSVAITGLPIPSPSSVELIAAGWTPIPATVGELVAAQLVLLDSMKAMLEQYEYFLKGGREGLAETL